jgi:hypothetical protein
MHNYFFVCINYINNNKVMENLPGDIESPLDDGGKDALDDGDKEGLDDGGKDTGYPIAVTCI